MMLDERRPFYTGEELDAMPAGQARLLEVATLELGPQDPDKYWSRVCPELMGQPHRISWCGGFYLWCLTEALIECRHWKWIWGKGFLQSHPLPITREPLPGDLAYFGGKLHHYAMVELVVPGKLIQTIDGNQGIAPDELVKRRHYSVSEVHTFYSIRGLI